MIAVVAAAATWTVHRLERSLESQLGERLEAVAASASTAISPERLLELDVEGTAGLAYGRLVLDLELVRSSAKAVDVIVLARSGRVLLDLGQPRAVGGTWPLFEAERIAVTRALAGRTSSTRLYRARDVAFKTGFAPVRGVGGEVAAVVGVEADVDFLAPLAETRRNLVITLGPALAAVVLLSAFFVRQAYARARLEREYARAESLAAVGELAATLAHEVRNPLGIIQRAAERLRRGYAGEEPELFDYIREECERLAGTVRRYLDFARPAAHGETAGDAAAAARATVALLEPEARDRHVALGVTADGEGPWQVALGDGALKQTLLNLLRNSLEAFAEARGDAPEGVQPALGAPERRARIETRLTRAGRRVEIAVADNGPGMARETLRRAREPFFTTRAQGSGLGLAIVDRLVREVGGTMRVASSPGRGTTVTLDLPMVEERA